MSTDPMPPASRPGVCHRAYTQADLPPSREASADGARLLPFTVIPAKAGIPSGQTGILLIPDMGVPFQWIFPGPVELMYEVGGRETEARNRPNSTHGKSNTNIDQRMSNYEVQPNTTAPGEFLSANHTPTQTPTSTKRLNNSTTQQLNNSPSDVTSPTSSPCFFLCNHLSVSTMGCALTLKTPALDAAFLGSAGTLRGSF